MVTTSGRGSTVSLEAVDLYRFYHAGNDETLALRGVSLQVAAGEIVAVSGPSGSGKSTLLACLAGLDEPDGGVVRIAGERMTRRPEAERAALRAQAVGLLFQSGNLIDHLSVWANVRLALRLAGRPDRGRAAALLGEVGLEHRGSAIPRVLSGGESARAGLAVALANDPAVILADEPTGELDEGTAAQVMALLRARADGGAAVVIVTHNPLISLAADRELGMVDGRVTP